jgi:hypothetical protein
MKIIRTLTLLGGLAMLAMAIAFIFRLPLALNLWPWEDGRYSYLFIGSILAAASAAALWIGWMGELCNLPAGTLNLFVIGLTTSIYFFYLYQQGRSEMLVYAVVSLLAGLISGAFFLWSRRLPPTDPRPTPGLVRVSFGIFVATLLLAGTALILRMPIFPWDLNPDSSVIFGCIFLGDAFYFIYALLRPHWGNAFGQLLSFLAYDLVLIVPFLLLLESVKPGHMQSLIIYIVVLLYSGGLAVYYLFLNPQTRVGSLLKDERQSAD